MVNPDDFIISRKRKKYRFAHFENLENCFELEQWHPLKIIQPIVVEVGAGTALFLVELARRHPEHHYIALDIKGDRLQKGGREAQRLGLTNIQFVRARADQLLEVVAPASVSQLWLTFSDPFPKKRAAKHRLTHTRFLRLYAKALRSGGMIRQKTDNHTLFDWSLEQLVAQRWLIDELTFDLHGSVLTDDYKILTTFEQRFVEQNLPIYFVSAHR